MFDSGQFKGFVKNELDALLCSDVLNYCVFNESDLHACAYYHIREYLEKRKSNNSFDIIVRCEPRLEDKTKPDIVVYHKYNPVYVLELKMMRRPEEIWKKEDKVYEDTDKLKSYLHRYPSIKWGFQIVVYDSENMFKPSDPKLRQVGYRNISLSTINLRRNQDSEYRRQYYDEWRAQFDMFLDRHF